MHNMYKYGTIGAIGDCSSAVERLPVEEDAGGSNPLSHPQSTLSAVFFPKIFLNWNRISIFPLCFTYEPVQIRI